MKFIKRQRGHFLWSYFAKFSRGRENEVGKRESRETKASLKCAPERRQFAIRVLGRAVPINPILSLYCSLLPRQRQHITQRNLSNCLDQSRSHESPHIAVGFRLHSGRNGGNISYSSRTLKLSLSNCVFQAFPFWVSDLCRIPFKSCKTPLANWNRMPRLPFPPLRRSSSRVRFSIRMKFISKQGIRSAANV